MPYALPSFPNKASKANPYQPAYAWAPGVYLDRSPGGSARVVFNVHPTESDWQDDPIGQVEMRLGSVARPAVQADPNADPPVEAQPEIRYRTLEEMLADQTPIANTGLTFMQAFTAMGLGLYVEGLKNPAFDGAEIIP